MMWSLLIAPSVLMALHLIEYACSPFLRSTILPLVLRQGGWYDFLAIVKYVLILTPQRCVRLLGHVLMPGAPPSPPRTIFIIGLPRSATSHIHDCLLKACGASAAVFLDNLFPRVNCALRERVIIHVYCNNMECRVRFRHD